MQRWLQIGCTIVIVQIPAAVDAQRAVTTDTAVQFVASSRGQVYYWIGCGAWRRLTPSTRLFFRTAAEAERAGYTPSESQGCAPQVKSAVDSPSRNNPFCMVSEVLDGDSFKCVGGERVRLLLVDTPEMGQRPFGAAARDSAARLMPVGSRVRLEFDVQLRDQYRRLLAYVYVDSLMVNRQLARNGMGLVDVYQPNVRYVELVRAAVDSARKDKAGLWSTPAFACRPADYRGGRCR